MIAYLLTFLLVLVYRGWFLTAEILGGDWPYRYPEIVRDMARIPSAWFGGYGVGVGGLSPSYFLSIYNFFPAWIATTMHLPWTVTYKLFWFFLPVLLSAFGGWKLTATLNPSFPLWARGITSMILATNTYALMIAGGGQMGVFFSVSLIPWILLAFFRFLESPNHRLMQKAVVLGVVFGLQLSLDPRIAYISGGILALLFLCNFDALRIRYGAIVVFISVILNSYWLLPLGVTAFRPLEVPGQAYTTKDALQFFSFADFSHAISLLHPNWPENIFGKTYFLRPEFLLLPLLAFGSLLFAARKTLAFALVALVGAFLAKGANEPFGGVFVWLFEHVPGFVMFRDPTKFYVMIAVSYAVLIPNFLVSLTKKRAWIVPLFFLGYWSMLIWPAISGNLGGTFTKKSVPGQYVTLKEWQAREPGFFRTLWVPRQSRFAFSTPNQFPVEAEPLFSATDAASLRRVFGEEGTKERLTVLGIRYIIVPFDPYGELFREDRVYSPQKRMAVERMLDGVPWLTKIQTGDIAVYKTPEHRDRFWVEGGSISAWRRFADDYFEVDVSLQNPGKLVMSESYHPGWVAKANADKIPVVKEPHNIMSFALPELGSYTVAVEFFPRRWFVVGKIVSLVTLFVLLIYVRKTR